MTKKKKAIKNQKKLKRRKIKKIKKRAKKLKRIKKSKKRLKIIKKAKSLVSKELIFKVSKKWSNNAYVDKIQYEKKYKLSIKNN